MESLKSYVSSHLQCFKARTAHSLTVVYDDQYIRCTFLQPQHVPTLQRNIQKLIMNATFNQIQTHSGILVWRNFWNFQFCGMTISLIESLHWELWVPSYSLKIPWFTFSCTHCILFHLSMVDSPMSYLWTASNPGVVKCVIMGYKVLEDNLAITRSNVPNKTKQLKRCSSKAITMTYLSSKTLLPIFKHTQTTPSPPKQPTHLLNKNLAFKDTIKRLRFLED